MKAFIIYLYPLPFDLTLLDAINSKSIMNAKRDKIDCGGQQRPDSCRLPFKSHHHGCFLTSKHISIPFLCPYLYHLTKLMIDSTPYYMVLVPKCVAVQLSVTETRSKLRVHPDILSNERKKRLQGHVEFQIEMIFSNIMLLMIILTLEILIYERLLICSGRGLGVVSSFCTFYSVLQMMKGKIM